MVDSIILVVRHSSLSAAPEAIEQSRRILRLLPETLDLALLHLLHIIVGCDLLSSLIVEQRAILVRRMEELVLGAAEKFHLALQVFLDQPSLLLPAQLLKFLQFSSLSILVLLTDASKLP